MQFLKKITVSDSQLVLLFKNQQLHKILPTGVYTFWDWQQQLSVQNVQINNPLQQELSTELLFLAERYPQLFAPYIKHWQTGAHEVGLVYENANLKDIKAPGQRGAYWLGHQAIQLQLIDIAEKFEVPSELTALLHQSREPLLLKALLPAVLSTTLPEGHTGFLLCNGKTHAELCSGLHLWWKFGRELQVKSFDLRLQNMEINGQDILTKDRVSLRVNLSAMWQIVDAESVRSQLVDVKDYLYRELQLALRTVVSTQTLDELLVDKNLLNQQVATIVSSKAEKFGIALHSVGARDIILPGEMKAILTQVVEAQKLAEANLIKRQEETQATRSLHNTAKVMEGNPVLLRLKELEVLEKITARIQNLNVYGGLDGVMNDLVKLTDRKAAS